MALQLGVYVYIWWDNNKKKTVQHQIKAKFKVHCNNGCCFFLRLNNTLIEIVIYCVHDWSEQTKKKLYFMFVRVKYVMLWCAFIRALVLVHTTLSVHWPKTQCYHVVHDLLCVCNTYPLLLLFHIFRFVFSLIHFFCLSFCKTFVMFVVSFSMLFEWIVLFVVFSGLCIVKLLV